MVMFLLLEMVDCWIDGSICTAVLHSRVLPEWAAKGTYFDPVSQRYVSYLELCPKTPLIVFNHYWDDLPFHAAWPKTKQLYLMPNIEMYELEAKHYWQVDVVLCKTRLCERRVSKWYRDHGNRKNTTVLYTRFTSTDLATYTRKTLGTKAIAAKNFSIPSFLHTAGNRYDAMILCNACRGSSERSSWKLMASALFACLPAVATRAHSTCWIAGSVNPTCLHSSST